jgi:hypothetical protein
MRSWILKNGGKGLCLFAGTYLTGRYSEVRESVRENSYIPIAKDNKLPEETFPIKTETKSPRIGKK